MARYYKRTYRKKYYKRKSPYYKKRTTYKRRGLYKRSTKQRTVTVRKFKIGVNMGLFCNAGSDHTRCAIDQGGAPSGGVINVITLLNEDAEFRNLIEQYDEFRVGYAAVQIITQQMRRPDDILETLIAVDRNSFPGRTDGIELDPQVMRTYESISIRHSPGDQRLRFGTSIRPIGYAENTSYVSSDQYRQAMLTNKNYCVEMADRAAIPYNPCFLAMVCSTNNPFNK